MEFGTIAFSACHRRVFVCHLRFIKISFQLKEITKARSIFFTKSD